MSFGSYSTFGVRGLRVSLKYSCSFDGSTSHKSNKKKVFDGIKCGTYYVGKPDAIVKAFHRQDSSEKRCDQEMEAAAEVRRLAKQFCEAKSDVSIRVLVPGKAQVDDLTMGNGRKSWPLHRNQWVLVEDKVSGTFHQFTDEFGECKNVDFRELETFAHYVYHETEGEMVVCNLQGVCKQNHFQLVSPIVHSADQSYGPRDGGQEGIARFFSKHRCSKACRDWLNPETLGRHLESKGRPPASSSPIDINRRRDTSPQGGFDWSSPGGSDDIDFRRWSTVGPFGSPLSPPMHGFSPAPPYASPSLYGTSPFHLYCQRMMGSPPPAYDVIPSAPYESDVMAEESDVRDTFEDKRYRPDLPPPYEVACRGLET